MSDRKDSFITRAIHGRLLTGSMFTRYWWQFLVILAMLLVYITNVFSCRSKMENIARLQDRLIVVQTESMRVRGAYMSRIRESEMRDRLDSMNLHLSVQQQPPFRIKLNE